MLEIVPAQLVGLKKNSTKTLTSAAIVVADSVLLNKNSSFIFLSLSHQAKAIKWLSRTLLVDSSS